MLVKLIRYFFPTSPGAGKLLYTVPPRDHKDEEGVRHDQLKLTLYSVQVLRDGGDHGI